MEIVIIVAVMVVSWWIGSQLGKLSRLQYRAKWEASGRKDAEHGYPRFNSEVKWIQKYYDTGYNSVEKEKANVYSNY